ncbi:MAG: SpoIIE family protein phosphatase [Verrucomicrobiales bacterium]|nr:SpoIIE family protein phosphatase [Verrucomicrobiales bacterium]
MEHFIYASIIAGIFSLFFILWNAEHRSLRRIAREKEAIEVEERRMIDFLHGLGEELLEDSSPSRMHMYIVKGVANVVGANGGILYLVDNQFDKLVPVAQTENTTPIAPFPKNLRSEEETAGGAQQYRSFIRLSPLNRGDGLIGKTIEGNKVISIDDLAQYFEEDEVSEHFHRGVAVLVAPLIYANKKIGALAVSRPGNNPFNANDRAVFASVTEQSSFALGSAIIHAEAHEKRRLESELAQASEIQRILLPKSDPELSDYRMAATYRPARHVSGDYYDYVKVDDNHYGVAVADVCGKGIAASLIMAMCRSSLRSNSAGNLRPAHVLHKVNKSIFPDIREDMFVSFIYLIFERGSQIISVANAGHEPPLIRRANKEGIEMCEVPGMAVGVDKGGVFQRVVKNHELTMESGDILLLYTDGLIEAMDIEGEEYGIERFMKTFQEADGSSADELLDVIIKDVESFCEGTNATDDITLIAVEKR